MKQNTLGMSVIVLALGIVIGVLVGMQIQARKFSAETIAGGSYDTHVMPDGSVMSNNHTNDMTTMMHDMNKALEGKTGTEFDQAFLKEMIVHHQGAVDMAEQVLKVSKRPELIKLANDIITAQNKEIEMMQGWQTAWGK
jgi:uncharacterized protein (DUF305 family)